MVSPFNTTVQREDVPQPPMLQPVNTESPSGHAFSVTEAPAGYVAAQAGVQLMPPAAVTDPGLPVGKVTLSV